MCVCVCVCVCDEGVMILSHITASYTQGMSMLLPSKKPSGRQTHTHTAMYAHSVATQEMGDEEEEACLLAEASSRSSLSYQSRDQ